MPWQVTAARGLAALRHSKLYTIKNATARKFSKGLWQDSFYDHIIRDQLDYDTIWRYIDDNPAKWHLDQFYIPDGEDHP